MSATTLCRSVWLATVLCTSARYTLASCVLLLCALPVEAFATVIVRDDTGSDIRLATPAKRIVTLAPSQAELVVAAGGGDRIVGVSSFSDDPALAPTLPVVAAAGRVDLERVLQLRPDLIVAWHSGNRARDVERLRQLGLTVFVTEPRRLGDIARLVRVLGKALGTDAAAERAAQAFDAAITSAHEPGRKPVRTFVALWHQPLITVNDTHLIADVMRTCGAHNVFADLPLLAPRVSAEQLLAANPQLIIASGATVEQAHIIEAFAGFQRVDAVRDGRVIVIDPTLFQRQSPRLAAGLQAICAAVARAAS